MIITDFITCHKDRLKLSKCLVYKVKNILNFMTALTQNGPDGKPLRVNILEKDFDTNSFEIEPGYDGYKFIIQYEVDEEDYNPLNFNIWNDINYSYMLNYNRGDENLLLLYNEYGYYTIMSKLISFRMNNTLTLVQMNNLLNFYEDLSKLRIKE